MEVICKQWSDRERLNAARTAANVTGKCGDTNEEEWIVENMDEEAPIPKRTSRGERSQPPGRSEVDQKLSDLGRNSIDLFIGESSAAKQMWEKVVEYAPSPYPILLCGPSGSGKTQLARAVHELSARKAAPFRSITVTELPGDLAQVALLGCVRGAYTGAVSDRAGAVESAHGGTLLVDELGHASPLIQQAMLGLIESRSIQRVGDFSQRSVDVRFLFASSHSLHERVEAGTFLPELFYRVEGLTISVPPLSARRGDILPLIDKFLRECAIELGLSSEPSLSQELQRALHDAPWPGNLRQLKSACRAMCMRARTFSQLEIEDIPESLLPRQLSLDARRAVARRAVARAGGNVAEAARILGISRTTLYKLLGGEQASS